MAKKQKFQARFDEETDFALWLLAKQQGKKLTAVVEESINSQAEKLALEELGQEFSTLYHPHEGVRLLNLLGCPGYKRSPNENDLRAFLRAHKEFFYTDDTCTIPLLGYVMTLWEKIEHYRELWRDKRHENYWVAAEAMEAALKKAKIKPPKYGQGK